MVGRKPVLVFVALLSGCAAESSYESSVSRIAIAGPWVPSVITRSIASTQRVTVVDPPAVSPLGRWSPRAATG